VLLTAALVISATAGRLIESIIIAIILLPALTFLVLWIVPGEKGSSTVASQLSDVFCLILYGIASPISGDMEDFYSSPEEAEAVLAAILRDEPDFEGELWVQAVEFERSAN